jgi:hypothetical protein
MALRLKFVSLKTEKPARIEIGNMFITVAKIF